MEASPLLHSRWPVRIAQARLICHEGLSLPPRCQAPPESPGGTHLPHLHGSHLLRPLPIPGTATFPRLLQPLSCNLPGRPRGSWLRPPKGRRVHASAGPHRCQAWLCAELGGPSGRLRTPGRGRRSRAPRRGPGAHVPAAHPGPSSSPPRSPPPARRGVAWSPVRRWRRSQWRRVPGAGRGLPSLEGAAAGALAARPPLPPPPVGREAASQARPRRRHPEPPRPAVGLRRPLR